MTVMLEQSLFPGDALRRWQQSTAGRDDAWLGRRRSPDILQLCCVHVRPCGRGIGRWRRRWSRASVASLGRFFRTLGKRRVRWIGAKTARNLTQPTISCHNGPVCHLEALGKRWAPRMVTETETVLFRTRGVRMTGKGVAATQADAAVMRHSVAAGAVCPATVATQYEYTPPCPPSPLPLIVEYSSPKRVSLCQASCSSLALALSLSRARCG